ncbi:MULTISPECIES: TetR/AcrR family transcriptional regulator [Streptosporangium]|uniref:TetR/AcrR family transcriptional regulator n=1 Tax=Streptosporangium TaxID=2000 RepID=UPI0027D80FDD|nr:TetR/AcrR family transcriptional regulator [Streptosporangium brasiliense]
MQIVGAVEERRRRNRARKRRLIGDAAVSLALERGLESLTVEGIAEAADISTRTFFNYFSTKEEALTVGPSSSAEELAALVTARPADEPVVRSMRFLAKEIAESFVPSREQVALWRRNPELLARARRPADQEQIFVTLMRTVADRMEADLPREVYPSVLVVTTFSIIEWAVRASWQDDVGKSLDDLIDEAFDLIERGL